MDSRIRRIILFWPLTFVAGLVYVDVWSTLTKGLTFTALEGPEWTTSLLFFITGYVVLTILVGYVAETLLKYFRAHWKRAPQSDLILFVLCWILALAILLNPNTIVGVYNLLFLTLFLD